MKKIYFALFAIFSLTFNSWAQPGFAWVAGFNTTSSQEGKAITLDNLNNVYTIGVFQGSPDFDPGAGTFTLPWSGGTNWDVFICKLDANKNFVWAKKITGNGTAGGVRIDNNGDVLITGTFGGTQDFDPGAGTFGMTSGTGGGCYITKLNSLGNFVWAKQFTANSSVGITTDLSANVIVTGGFVFTAELDPSASTFTLASAGGVDAYVLKLNSSGNFIWGAQVASGTLNESTTGIKVDAVGDVYFTGNFRSQNCDFDPSASSFTMSPASTTNDDIFISKLDAAGNFVWAKRIGSTNTDNAYAIEVDNANDVLITGYFFGSVDFDPGAGTYIITSSGGGALADIYICKLTSSGNFVWAKQYTNGSGKIAYAIATDATRNVYTTGYVYGTVDFDPGAGIFTLTTPNLSDIYIAALDVSGNFKWAGLLISTSYGAHTAEGITASSTGDIYSTGKINRVTDFDPGAGVTYYGTNGGPSAYVHKMNSCTAAPPVPGAIVGSTTICSASGASSYSVTLVSGATSYGWSLPAAWSGTSSTNFISATPGTTGIFTVTASNACGSSPQRTLNVTVNPSPTISVNSGSICSGNSFTISPSGANTYTIQGGSAVVSPTVSTNYTVIGTSSAGCVSANTATASLTVNSLPTIVVNSGSICAGQSFTMVPSGANTYTIQGGSAVVSPTANANYTVIGTSSVGCISTNTATASITVNSLPTITVNNGSICAGQSFTMVPSGANTYTIQGGSAVVSPTATTSYTVVGTSTAGCVSSSPATSNLTVSPLPTISASTSNTMLCVGQSATITASGASTYTFNPGGTGASIVVSPTVTSNYTITGTSAQGCNNSSVFTQSVSTCAGIDQILNSVSEVNVYPNPTTGKLYIQVPADFTLHDVEVFNALGSLIYKAEIEKEKIEIDLSDKPHGIYFLKIGVNIKKIIKE